MTTSPESTSTRPAWVEIDLDQLRRNFEIIRADRPKGLQFCVVVKDQAYGHGAVAVAKVAVEAGAACLAVATVDEALELRQSDVTAPILVFGERTPEELRLCLEHDLTCFVNDEATVRAYARLAANANRRVPVHVEVDTGLSRYGVRWTQALPVLRCVREQPALELEGVMSHFAMSDELDKSFALEQLQRFQQVLQEMARDGIQVKWRHMCNTGGYLDLPQAHFDLVRVGILPLGVYPSQVCRRIPGLKPVMSVKTRIAALKTLEPGDYVGYGMRYQAERRSTIAVLPIGYGDGFPRVRNRGHVLIQGKRAPIVGGNAMDATMVDVGGTTGAWKWQEVVLLGAQGDAEIDVHEIARLGNTVSYDILTGWRWRLPRRYKTGEGTGA